MIRLGVNIDHAATLREARYRGYGPQGGAIVEPDVVGLAQLAERAGADGITVHPREDARHIQRGDVRRLAAALQVGLNMEMAATEAMVAFALEVKPRTVCIVPEQRAEVTTEGGLGVVGNVGRLGPIVAALRAADIGVSLFIDPDAAQVEASAALGVEYVELHTGAFANAWGQRGWMPEWERLREGAELAHSLGLVVNIGHGINYANIEWARRLPHVHEMNIGHSILARALWDGLGAAVREMKARVNGVVR